MIGFSSKMKSFRKRMDVRFVRLIVVIVILVLFVLSAGAPSGLGGIGMQGLDSNTTNEQCLISLNGLAHLSPVAMAHLEMNGLDCNSSP